MKRQRFRKVLILISFLLFPVTMWYFSPYLIIDGSTQGIIVGSFIVFSLQFASSLFLGRGFCGWACPAAGHQETFFLACDRKARGGRLNWIKYFIWVPWIGGIVIAVVSAGGYHTIDLFWQTTYGISIAEPESYVIFYFILGLATVLALTAGRRGFCHYVCWMAPFMVIGAKIRNAAKWPALHLILDKGKCQSCLSCTKNCPMSLDVNGMVQKGSMVNSECILCGTCVDTCPQDAISYSFKAGL